MRLEILRGNQCEAFALGLELPSSDNGVEIVAAVVYDPYRDRTGVLLLSLPRIEET